VARQTRLTPALRAEIINRVKAGAHPVRAAQSLGVPGATFNRWMAKADTEPGIEDPDLDHMPAKQLRQLGKTAEVTLPRNAKPATLAAVLRQAGVCSWDDYRAFRAEIEAADAEAELRNLAQVQEDAQKDPRSRLAFMERRWRDRWAKENKVQVTGPNGGPVEIDVTVTAGIADKLAAYYQGVNDSTMLEVESHEAG